MRIVIVKGKSFIQAVYVDVPDSRCAILDLDVDDVDPDELYLTPHGQECTIDFRDVECKKRYVEGVFTAQTAPDLPRIEVLKMASVLTEVVAAEERCRHCPDMRRAMEVWTEVADRARGILTATTGPV